MFLEKPNATQVKSRFSSRCIPRISMKAKLR